MALTRTVVGSGTAANTTVGTAHDSTINCGTVTSGDLLLIACNGTVEGSGRPVWSTPAKSSGTATIGTVTLISTADAGGTFVNVTMAWRIPITGTGTLVLSYGDAVSSYGPDVMVLSYNGQDPTTPVAGATTSTASGDLANATLGATPAAADETVIFMGADVDETATAWNLASTDFTSRLEQATTTNYVMSLAATRAGSVSTSTTVNWPNENTADTVYGMSGVTFIVKAAAGGGATNVDAGHAAGTGTANNASGKVSPNAGTASATGTANQPAAKVNPNAGTASATGVANNPTITASSNVPAGTATATGVANQPTITASSNVPAGTATATGVANDATVSTQSATNAPAELASAAGVANQASTKVSPNAGTATAAGVANDATVSTSAAGSASAGHAAGTGEAQQPAAKVNPNAGTATATGTANNATVSTDSSKSVDAGHASATGEAFQPSIKVTFNAGHATGTGAAERPLAAIMPAAGTATASSTAGAAAVALYVSAAIALATGTAYDVAGPNTPDAILLDFIVRRARPGIVNVNRPGIVRRQRPRP